MTLIYPPTSATVWVDWNSSITTSTAVNHWVYWTGNLTTTATVTGRTYGMWVDEHQTRRVFHPSQVATPTPEQVAAQARYREAEAQRMAVLRREREEAEARAETLLLQHLDEEQRHEYLKHRHFHVRTPLGNRYRIRRGRVANVDVLDASGKIVRRLCAHPGISCPDQDTMLAQKLMLHFNETEFVRTANVH